MAADIKLPLLPASSREPASIKGNIMFKKLRAARMERRLVKLALAGEPTYLLNAILDGGIKWVGTSHAAQSLGGTMRVENDIYFYLHINGKLSYNLFDRLMSDRLTFAAINAAQIGRAMSDDCARLTPDEMCG